MTAQQAMSNAIDPIATAVHNAENSQNQTQDTQGHLPMVEEELESNTGGHGPNDETAEHRFHPGIPPRDVPATQPSFFSMKYWAPRREGFGEEDENGGGADISANDRIRQARQDPGVGTVMLLAKPKYWNTWLVLQFILVFMILLLALFGYDIYRGPVFGSKYDFLRGHMSPRSQLPYSATKDFANLNRRINKVEQQLQDLQVNFDPSNVAPKHKINWFSPGLGAVVDAFLSSPVATKCVSPYTTIPGLGWSTGLMPRALSKYLHPGMCAALLPFSGNTVQALLPWQDVHERYCAPSERGKLQLTVYSPRAIAPTELVVEHLHKEATFAIGNAPKEVELWIHIADEETRAKVSDAIGSMFPEYWQTSSPQANKELHEDQALDGSFVPVGRWIYNIYERENTQSFRIPIHLEDYGVKTRVIAIRVNSNWGDVGPTCLYRLKLHGKDQSGIKEYLEEDPKLVARLV